MEKIPINERNLCICFDLMQELCHVCADYNVLSYIFLCISFSPLYSAKTLYVSRIQFREKLFVSRENFYGAENKIFPSEFPV